MTPTNVLKASIKFCMFDQYGTIVDMQTGLTEIAGPYLESKGWKGNPNSFVTWWRRTHFENSMIDALPRCRRRSRGLRVAIASSCFPTAIRTCLRRRSSHGIAFDDVISVAVANAFKPHLATYTKAAELAGVRMDEVLFVANHAFDCIGAKSAGMRTAFIDRRRRPFGMTPHQPDLLVSSMRGLADAIA
jgi:2-haloacid dehalogenase